MRYVPPPAQATPSKVSPPGKAKMKYVPPPTNAGAWARPQVGWLNSCKIYGPCPLSHVLSFELVAFGLFLCRGSMKALVHGVWFVVVPVVGMEPA